MSRSVKQYEMVCEDGRIVGTASELAGLLHYCRGNIYMAVRRGCKIGKRWTIRELLQSQKETQP